MNRAIIKNHNEVVSEDDDVYVLGDLMLNDNEGGLWFIKRLRGRIHIILGNHDTDTRERLYCECYNVVEIVYATIVKYGKYHFYLSHYPTLTSNFDIEKPLKQRLINLCGHSHTTDRWADWDKGFIYHCELDAHECKPVLLDDIIEELKIKCLT